MTKDKKKVEKLSGRFLLGAFGLALASTAINAKVRANEAVRYGKGQTKTTECHTGTTPKNLENHTPWRTLGISPVPSQAYGRTLVVWECTEILEIKPVPPPKFPFGLAKLDTSSVKE